MIDYILGFNNRANAKEDGPAASHFHIDTDAWQADHTQEVRVTRISTGNDVPPGFYVMISSSVPIAELLDHPALKIAIDRDKANARQAGAVLRTTLSNPVLQDVVINPVYAGADFPWGQFT